MAIFNSYVKHNQRVIGWLLIWFHDNHLCQGIKHADQEVEFLVQQVRQLCHERKSIRQDCGPGPQMTQMTGFFDAERSNLEVLQSPDLYFIDRS